MFEAIETQSDGVIELSAVDYDTGLFQLGEYFLMMSQFAQMNIEFHENRNLRHYRLRAYDKGFFFDVRSMIFSHEMEVDTIVEKLGGKTDARKIIDNLLKNDEDVHEPPVTKENGEFVYDSMSGVPIDVKLINRDNDIQIGIYRVDVGEWYKTMFVVANASGAWSSPAEQPPRVYEELLEVMIESSRPLFRRGREVWKEI